MILSESKFNEMMELKKQADCVSVEVAMYIRGMVWEGDTVSDHDRNFAEVRITSTWVNVLFPHEADEWKRSITFPVECLWSIGEMRIAASQLYAKVRGLSYHGLPTSFANG